MQYQWFSILIGFFGTPIQLEAWVHSYSLLGYSRVSVVSFFLLLLFLFFMFSIQTHMVSLYVELIHFTWHKLFSCSIYVCVARKVTLEFTHGEQISLKFFFCSICFRGRAPASPRYEPFIHGHRKDEHLQTALWTQRVYLLLRKCLSIHLEDPEAFENPTKILCSFHGAFAMLRSLSESSNRIV